MNKEKSDKTDYETVQKTAMELSNQAMAMALGFRYVDVYTRTKLYTSLSDFFIKMMIDQNIPSDLFKEYAEKALKLASIDVAQALGFRYVDVTTSANIFLEKLEFHLKNITKSGGQTKKVIIEEKRIEKIFPEQLIKDLGKDFTTEISDLKLNYGVSGTCTAFLLRKILEKLIFIAFFKNNLTNKLKDENGNFVGLKTMINLATTNSVQGKPFLMPKTANEIEGIKFLGDASAHNPLTNVDMETIIPQMPFIITAYEELSKKL
jgi:hypothetical protein